MGIERASPSQPASAEDPVGHIVDALPGLRRGLDVELGHDVKAIGMWRFGYPDLSVREVVLQQTVESVGWGSPQMRRTGRGS